MPPKYTNNESTTSKSTFFAAKPKTDEKRELIYSRMQFGKTFNFYINEEGRVSVGYMCDNQEERSLLINGLPSLKLLGEDRKTVLYQILQESYFTVLGDSVQINGRLKGGWGDEIHEGSTPSLCPYGRIISLEQRSMKDAAGNLRPVEGTLDWAIDMGFADDQAHRIAASCVGVDAFWSGTYPVPFIGDQSWHFNTTRRATTDGDIHDTRIQHAVEKLQEAVLEWGNARENFTPSVLHALGRGLHPLQDVFAHTIPMVNKYLGGMFQEHITSRGQPDNPLYISNEEESPNTFVKISSEQFCSQRYSDTKTATYLYLLLFLHATRLVTQPQFESHVEKIVNNLIEGKHPRINGTNVEKFFGLLERIRTTTTPRMHFLSPVAKALINAANEILSARNITQTKENAAEIADRIAKDARAHADSHLLGNARLLQIDVHKDIEHGKYQYTVTITILLDGRNVPLASGKSKWWSRDHRGSAIRIRPIINEHFAHQEPKTNNTDTHYRRPMLPRHASIHGAQVALTTFKEDLKRVGYEGVLQNEVSNAITKLTKIIREKEERAEELECAVLEAKVKISKAEKDEKNIQKNAVQKAWNEERRGPGGGGPPH